MAKFNFDDLEKIASDFNFLYKDQNEVISSIMSLSVPELKVLKSTIDSQKRYGTRAESTATAVKAAIEALLEAPETPSHSVQKAETCGGVKEAMKLLETVQVSGLDNILKIAKVIEILKSL